MCCCSSETRNGPIEPEKFQTNFPSVSFHKLYERLILNRLSPIIEHVLIPEQASKYCTAQVLNFIQHIEDVFEIGEVTGIVLVDLSAAYNTMSGAMPEIAEEFYQRH